MASGGCRGHQVSVPMFFETAEDWRTSFDPTCPTKCEQCGEDGYTELFWFGDGQATWSDAWYCWSCICDGHCNGADEAKHLTWRVYCP